MMAMKFEELVRGELLCLLDGPSGRKNDRSLGCVRFSVRCPFGAASVLNKAKSVLIALDEQILLPQVKRRQWREVLPTWFCDECAPRMSSAQAEQLLACWRMMTESEKEKSELEKQWSLDDWLYWVANDSRQWYWWDAYISDDGESMAVAVQVLSWPFAWGALRWLFTASGAAAVLPEK